MSEGSPKGGGALFGRREDFHGHPYIVAIRVAAKVDAMMMLSNEHWTQVGKYVESFLEGKSDQHASSAIVSRHERNAEQ